jgi:hypothetical protein
LRTIVDKNIINIGSQIEQLLIKQVKYQQRF